MTVLGLVLLVVGALIAVTEAHNPTHGIAGSIGVLVMAAGVVLGVDGLGAGLAFGLAGGAGLAVIGGGLVTLTVTRGLAVRRRRVTTGAEGLVGEIGVVRNWSDSTGSISLHGAVWRARWSAVVDPLEEPVAHAGDRVVVERLSGLTLSVRPAEEWELI